LETRFTAGRHKAQPVGDLMLPQRNELVLWHYKHLGFDRCAAREAAQGERLGSTDKTLGLAEHYSWSKAKLRAFWDQMERESTDLAGAAADRVCVGPLWWSDRIDIRHVATRSEPRPLAKPTVSVLVKSFNHAPYVRQTIESILNKSYQDFEIVVTDDASTDETAEIVRTFEDPRIRLEVNARNLGISGAMNATINRARGRYFAILNSDDWALPDRLQRQVDFLDANPHVSVVTSLPWAVDERGEGTKAFDDFERPLGFPDFSRRTWLRHFFFESNCICAPTAMIRREAYEAVGPYDRRLTNLQDFDMWIRMLLAGHSIHVMPIATTAFRIRDQNANTSAPRFDTMLRVHFEFSRILYHYLQLDRGDFEALFGDEAQETVTRPVSRRLAELALRQPGPFHKLFALEVLHETATSMRISISFEALQAQPTYLDSNAPNSFRTKKRVATSLSKRRVSRKRSPGKTLSRFLPRMKPDLLIIHTELSIRSRILRKESSTAMVSFYALIILPETRLELLPYLREWLRKITSLLTTRKKLPR
jgi:glycosyltransferase involved in cell wall biosynthesis